MTARRSIVVMDDFYADPMAVRGYALSQSFYPPYEDETDVLAGRTKATWWATRFRPADQCPVRSAPQLLTALERAVGERVDLAHWNATYPVDAASKPVLAAGDEPPTCLWNGCFHVKPDNGQQLGGGIHNHVTDRWNSVGEHGWAGIVYLHPQAPLDGGLHLWRNKDQARRFDWMTAAENWELVDSFGNVFNRLILVRGDVPHSGAGGWGQRLDEGRLYQTFFFRTAVSASPAVELPSIGA